jgi:hypothetical protein
MTNITRNPETGAERDADGRLVGYRNEVQATYGLGQLYTNNIYKIGREYFTDPNMFLTFLFENPESYGVGEYIEKVELIEPVPSAYLFNYFAVYSVNAECARDECDHAWRESSPNVWERVLETCPSPALDVKNFDIELETGFTVYTA